MPMSREEVIEFRKKWIVELRSGKYRQITGKLVGYNGENTFGFCCLGVACEFGNNRDMEYCWLTANHIPYDINKLTDMNDTQGKSFPKIADEIEKNLMINLPLE